MTDTPVLKRPKPKAKRFRIDPAKRRRIAAAIEAMINALDAIEDPDAEGQVTTARSTTTSSRDLRSTTSRRSAPPSTSTRTSPGVSHSSRHFCPTASRARARSIASIKQSGRAAALTIAKTSTTAVSRR